MDRPKTELFAGLLAVVASATITFMIMKAGTKPVDEAVLTVDRAFVVLVCILLLSVLIAIGVWL